jgi:predicted metal-dependent peptidase
MTSQETLTLNLRRAVSKDVGLAGILLYVPAEIVAHPEHVAWTDGSRMFFADRYFHYRPEEQVAIAIHEALHVALRHVQRGHNLALRQGPTYSHKLWNIACDAVINQSIRSSHWCELPSDMWFPEHCLNEEKLKQKPAERWTAEEIYYEIERHPPACLSQANGRSQSMPEDLGGQRQNLPGTDATNAQSMEQAMWRERMVRAQAGSAPSSVLRRVAADVPKTEVRWEAVLRNFLMARLMPLTESSWGRPSRRTLALGAGAEWIEAGVERQRGFRRAGVVIDTSGSIGDRLLAKFLAEINCLIRTTGCEVVLIDCDAAVQQVSVHRTAIRGYAAKGGGGTDFRPAIEALGRTPLDVAVYFTDLMGAFPERRPAFPLLWLTTQDLDVPFGRKVLLSGGGFQ